jgi:hypothetical protein
MLATNNKENCLGSLAQLVMMVGQSINNILATRRDPRKKCARAGGHIGKESLGVSSDRRRNESQPKLAKII